MGTVLYALKLVIFSIVAAIPTCFLRNALMPIFEGSGRLLGFGLPLFACALAFALVGVLLLVITKDEIVRVIIKKVRRR
jgi:putative peptidoglycan lipid II flippase